MRRRGWTRNHIRKGAYQGIDALPIKVGLVGRSWNQAQPAQFNIMLVPCSNPKCCERRIHHERPYENRPQQMIEVADDWSGPYMFCSLTCATEAGRFSMKHGCAKEGKSWFG